MKPARLATPVALLALVCAPLTGQERTFELEGLVVTATPTPRPLEAVARAVTVLEGAELRARGLTLVQQALREVPGVHVAQGGSHGAVSSVFVRGAESDHVLVLVDGVQVNQPGGSFDLAGLTLENVERVEVVRGPASALYGSDAVAGVIQIVTRQGRPGSHGSVATRVGTYGWREAAAEASGGSERAGYALSLTRLRTDGVLPFNNAHENTVVTGSLRFAPDAHTWSRVTVRVGDRRYHFPTDDAGVPVDRNAYTFGDETAVGAALGRTLGERFSVRALLGLNEVDTGTDDAQDGPADTLGYVAFQSLDHVRRSSAELRADGRFGAQVLTVGGEVESERQRSFTESLSSWGPSAGRSAYARRNRAVYGHLSGELGGLAFDAGARLEDNERFGRLATWQLGAALRLDGGTRVRAAAGTSIKEPTFFENFATGFARGNPDLEPERSTSWEVGVDRSVHGGRGRVSVAWFEQSLRDLIQYTYVTPTPDAPNFFNVAAADGRGLEVEAEGRAGALSGALAWTWLRTKVVDAGFDEGPGATFVTGEPLIRRPRHTLTVRTSYALGERASLSLAATRVGRRTDRDFSHWPSEPVLLPAYLDLGAGLGIGVLSGRKGGPSLSLTFKGENLLDRDRQEVYGFRSPGRMLLVGVRAGFGSGS